ncbi:MFS transporter [Sinomonas terrae]|uniref:MFS transporter n=1 Tax=Sinomonas terrae TaxID=2908838 RepID=UPI0027E1D90C|nr:MFS transporter [Sinomonas terrae]
MSAESERIRPQALQGAAWNLTLATVASVIGFWGWTVIAPLGTRYAQEMGLNPGQTGALVAMPVLVGAIGRVPVGVLTDRFGGRRILAVVLVATAPLVVLVALAGSLHSFPLMILFGFFLGVAGTVFTAGIPFSSAWYPAERRGFATGVFGMGMGGTALSAFLTPRLVQWIGYWPTHVLIAALLLATAALVLFGMRESPAWTPVRSGVFGKLVQAARLPVTWELCFLYAVVFGGFVSFSTYLPTYLRDIYSFDLTAAGTRTAGFALAAVIARPIGGIIADRIGPRTVVAVSLVGVAVLAFVVNLQPAPEIPTGLTFVAMAAALGLGTGGVFGWVGQQAPPGMVGAVTGVVSAAGGLGGYVPPLIMGATYNAAEHSYAIGLLLLVATALVALVLALVMGRTRRRAKGRAAPNAV